jgi:hypothetical protein
MIRTHLAMIMQLSCFFHAILPFRSDYWCMCAQQRSICPALVHDVSCTTRRSISYLQHRWHINIQYQRRSKDMRCAPPPLRQFRVESQECRALGSVLNILTFSFDAFLNFAFTNAVSDAHEKGYESDSGQDGEENYEGTMIEYEGVVLQFRHLKRGLEGKVFSQFSAWISKLG